MPPRSTPIRRNPLANLLLEASPVSIVLTDPAGSIEIVNRVTEDWFGYRECELVGKKLEILFPPASSSDRASQSACFLAQLRDPDPGKSWDLVGRRRDGSEFPVWVTLHLLVTASGDRILANVMGSRPADLFHQQRIASERLAAILEMVSGLAHQSRNALQRAQSCLDLLELDLAHDAELLQLTGRIHTALTDLRDHYERVKDYATPLVLKRTEMCLAQLCQASFDAIASQYAQRSPRLRIQCDPSCARVSVDPVRMKQVFLHLLENAVQANPPHGEVLVVCRPVSAAPDGAVEITVRDHGLGLSGEVAERMFEPFFTTKQHGTGLGLAVCRRLIAAHGGTIEAVNHPKGGVEVRIVLPT